MQLTLKQQQGLDEIVRRYLAKERYTVVAGFAGTGKSTLVKFAIATLSNYGIDPIQDVAYATFTGKAAQVLINKGNLNATTLHKLLYETRPLPNGKFYNKPKPQLDYKVVVVDEVSMAPKTLIDLLFSHNIYVIYLGDPFQLSPIDKNQDHGLLERPHVFLDEIMRQAADSEIIRLSKDIREGRPIKPYKGNETMVLSRKKFDPTMLLWADITLCAKNKTRTELNQLHRKLLNLDPDSLQEGDKIINLRNNWDLISNTGNAMTNGIIGTLSNFAIDECPVKSSDFSGPVKRYIGNFVSDMGDSFGSIALDYHLLITGEDLYSPRQKYILNKQGISLQEMVYGYAITTWKAQGSEFNKVLGIEENFPFDKIEHAKYLYTLVTRGSEKVVLIKQN